MESSSSAGTSQQHQSSEDESRNSNTRPSLQRQTSRKRITDTSGGSHHGLSKSPHKRSRMQQDNGAAAMGWESISEPDDDRTMVGESSSMETASYDSIDDNNTLENQNLNKDRCQLVHSIELTVNVMYPEKGAKKGKSMEGDQETIAAISACINTGIGGILNLKLQEEDMSKRKKLSKDRFDNTIDTYFVDNQSDHIGDYEMEDYNPCRPTRKVFVKAGNHKKILFQPAKTIYKRMNARVVEIFKTTELVGILTQPKFQERLPPLPQSPEECVCGDQLQFDESKVAEFKNSFNRIDDNFQYKCGRYICGFANTIGGHLIYGVDDEGTIGNKVEKKAIKKFHTVLVKHLKEMVWFHLEEGLIEPEEGIQYRLQTMAISGTKGMFVALTIPRFNDGIVYCKVPKCPVIDPESESGYSFMSCLDWCDYLKELANIERTRRKRSFLKQFRELNLMDSSVTTYALDKCSPSELQKRCLPVEKGKYTVWSDIPKDEYPEGLEDLISSCEPSETGVLVISNFARAFHMGHRQPGQVCDILLISNQKGVHLITTSARVTEEHEDDLGLPVVSAEDVARKVDHKLRTSCLQEKVASIHYVLCHHDCTNLRTFSVENCPRPQPSFFMDEGKLDGMLEALVVALNCASSAIAQIIGEQCLYLLTETQCNLLWKDCGRNKILFIHGVAGTGKTLMAHLIAQKLIWQDGYEAVLYVCENVDLRNSTSEKGIQAETRTKFTNRLKEGELKSVKHVIFDEAQNYRLNDNIRFDWYEEAKKLVRRNVVNKLKRGLVWVFMDMSQKDHKFPSGLPSCDYQSDHMHILYNIVRNPIEVSETVRNTRMVTRSQADLPVDDPDDPGLWEDDDWKKLYKDGILPDSKSKVAHNVRGKVEQRIVPNLNPRVVAKEVVKVVKRSMITIDVKNMVVLCSTDKVAKWYESALREEAKCLGLKVVRDPLLQEKFEGCLLIESVRKFSGLDRAVVIIVELSVADTRKHCLSRLYVQAISRSMMNVYFIVQKRLLYKIPVSQW